MKRIMALLLVLGVSLFIVGSEPALGQSPDLTGTWLGTVSSVTVGGAGGGPVRADLVQDVKPGKKPKVRKTFTGNLFECEAPCDTLPDPGATVEGLIKKNALSVVFDVLEAGACEGILFGSGTLSDDETVIIISASGINTDCLPEIWAVRLELE